MAIIKLFFNQKKRYHWITFNWSASVEDAVVVISKKTSKNKKATATQKYAHTAIFYCLPT